MLHYIYSAKTANGETKTGLVEAENELAAGKLLMNQGLTPLKVEIKDQSTNILSRYNDRVSAKDRIIFTRQLATLINAGLPLTQSLRTVAGQTSSKPLNLIVQSVISSVEGGTTLADSLAKHPDVFNEVYIALVAAGEASGTLDQTLERIAAQQEKDAEMISKLRGAIVYPVIILVVITGVVVFLLAAVVPQIKTLYDDFNKTLPLVTAILIGLADFITTFWWLVLIILVAGVIFTKNWLKTRSGSLFADNFKLKMPVFGNLYSKLYMARFSRAGATLMQSGVPMLEMLRITARAVDNLHVEAAIQRSSEKVKGGKALSSALFKESVFLALVPQMLSVGEQSGAIDAMMTKTAIYYENELDTQIKNISTLIEPILMVFLALVVGVIVMAILLPVYNLVGQNLTA